MRKTDLLDIIREKVHEVYLAYQKANGITHGDMYLEDVFELDKLMDKLADLVISSMKDNIPIRVGDVVTYMTNSRALVTAIENNEECFIIYGDGSTDAVSVKDLTRTGDTVSQECIDKFLDTFGSY